MNDSKSVIAELEASDEFKTRIIESSRDCIKVLDLDGRLLSINAGGMRLLEITDIEPLLHCPLAELFYGRDKAAANSAIETARNGRAAEFTAHCPTKGGKPKWWEVVVSPIQNRTGKVERLLAVSRDVTARKRAELQLATQHAVALVLPEAETLDDASPQILRAICENLTWDLSLLWLVDRKAEVLRCQQVWRGPTINAGEFEMASRERTFALGAGLPGRVWASGEPAWIPDIAADINYPRAPMAKIAGINSAFAFPIRLEHEVLGVMEFYSLEKRAPEEDLLAVMATIGVQIGQFIERKRTQQMINAIAAGTSGATGAVFFNALVRNLASAMGVRYAFVAECLGETKERAKSRAFWQGDSFGENFEYDVAATPCRSVLAGNVGAYPERVQVLFPEDRDLVTLQAESYLGIPLQDSLNKVIGHIAILDTQTMKMVQRDVAILRVFAARAAAELQRIKAEEELKTALSQLEALKNQLEAENVYLRSDLIANVSHDLRTPLASLRGYLETLLLKEDTLPAPQRRSYLEIASRQSAHLSTLVAELFELAKLNFKGFEIKREPVKLDELARDVLQKFELAAEKKGVALKVEAAAGVPPVLADIGLIERALENLIQNALEHSPADGKVAITIQSNPSAVRVQVADTGAGISKDDLPFIFERFYRGDKKRGTAGAGLGLAITKRIVELHGGDIGVRGSPGEGTSFYFTLPHAR